MARKTKSWIGRHDNEKKKCKFSPVNVRCGICLKVSKHGYAQLQYMYMGDWPVMRVLV